jgi:uncharacterized protein (TIGR03067 family)
VKHVLDALAVLVSLSATTLAAQAPAPTPSDSARLQGTWTMVSGAADGVSLPAAYVSSMNRVLAGSDLTVTMGGQLFFQATIRLDPGQTPKAIDYHMTGGPTAGAVQRGIYAFSGDTVRFCFGAPNAARPTEFKTVPGDGRTLSAWVPARP